LDPRFKCELLKQELEDEESALAIIGQLRAFLHRQYPMDKEPLLPPTLPTSVPKPKSLEDRLLERFQGQSKQVLDIDRYFDDGIINVSNVSKDNWLFEWWNTHQGEYPQMSRAAQDFLPLPASEVVCERLFSTGRDMLGLRRHRLNGETMRLLMLLKNGFDEE
jgi:hypothetical protein